MDIQKILADIGDEIIVLGAGESGNGAALLAKVQGYPVFVSDFGKIRPEYKKELQDEGISFEEGGHSLNRILKSRLVIKSPGIPENAPVVQEIRRHNILLISEIEWAYWFKGNSRIIGITGSNGKSTTTSLCYHLMKDAGKDVSMVGNIGKSFAAQVARHPTEWYVIEISSFQLDDILTFRPDTGVLLNITPDHLDRYGHKFENYAAAKFKIGEHQTEDDYLVLNVDDPTIAAHLKSNPYKSKILKITMNQDNLKLNEEGAFMNQDKITFKFSDEELGIPVNDLKIKGKHNQYNSMAAGISAMTAGLRKAKIRDSFGTFTGLEHRLEFVATVHGVDFINDSKGTNVNSVWYALESMTKPTVLILGGIDKGNDYNEIMDLVKEKVKAIVCLGKDNTPIHHAFDTIVPQVVDTASAADAVKAAYALSESGDVVLLSPACASFDLFTCFEDRGDQFKEAVRNL